ALAYRAAALEQPHLYDVMFACPIPEFEPSEEDQRLALGTLERLRSAVRRHCEQGALGDGDPDALTLQLWALAHGLASLELQRNLGAPGDAERHWRSAFSAAIAGYAAQPARAPGSLGVPGA
ncbi:MAG TPA: TetR-like C-terminal domain-containing protein, partial [Egibacteraceae bacterium]|nr:TetR-like C-terminal domain-containing protein [Egibacteraceae bacterium]